MSTFIFKDFYNLGLDKVINYQYADAVVTGLRKGDFGLLLAVKEDGNLKPGGIMEFMVPEAKKSFLNNIGS